MGFELYGQVGLMKLENCKVLCRILFFETTGNEQEFA
jgi:hypothetical protein